MIYRNEFFSFVPVWPPSFAVLRINSGPSARKCSTTELHLQPTATILDIYFFPQQTINKPRSNQSPNVPGIHPPHKSWGLVIWGKEKAPQHRAHQAVAAFCVCISVCSGCVDKQQCGSGVVGFNYHSFCILIKKGQRQSKELNGMPVCRRAERTRDMGDDDSEGSFKWGLFSAIQTNPSDTHSYEVVTCDCCPFVKACHEQFPFKLWQPLHIVWCHLPCMCVCWLLYWWYTSNMGKSAGGSTNQAKDTKPHYFSTSPTPPRSLGKNRWQFHRGILLTSNTSYRCY